MTIKKDALRREKEDKREDIKKNAQRSIKFVNKLKRKKAVKTFYRI
ncbi:MAG: hypothetical protein IJ852_05035 [Alphaproteobacteria bacterium]|nr:hypothetical protein [Alphaproteobacteria bacterium]